MGNIHTPIYKPMEKAAVIVFFIRAADELLDEKTYKLHESLDFEQDLFCHIIKPSTFTVPLTRFANQRARTAVAGEAKFGKSIFGK